MHRDLPQRSRICGSGSTRSSQSRLRLDAARRAAPSSGARARGRSARPRVPARRRRVRRQLAQRRAGRRGWSACRGGTGRRRVEPPFIRAPRGPEAVGPHLAPFRRGRRGSATRTAVSPLGGRARRPRARRRRRAAPATPSQPPRLGRAPVRPPARTGRRRPARASRVPVPRQRLALGRARRECRRRAAAQGCSPRSRSAAAAASRGPRRAGRSAARARRPASARAAGSAAPAIQRGTIAARAGSGCDQRRPAARPLRSTPARKCRMRSSMRSGAAGQLSPGASSTSRQWRSGRSRRQRAPVRVGQRGEREAERRCSARGSPCAAAQASAKRPSSSTPAHSSSTSRSNGVRPNSVQQRVERRRRLGSAGAGAGDVRRSASPAATAQRRVDRLERGDSAAWLAACHVAARASSWRHRDARHVGRRDQRVVERDAAFGAVDPHPQRRAGAGTGAKSAGIGKSSVVDVAGADSGRGSISTDWSPISSAARWRRPTGGLIGQRERRADRAIVAGGATIVGSSMKLAGFEATPRCGSVGAPKLIVARDLHACACRPCSVAGTVTRTTRSCTRSGGTGVPSSKRTSVSADAVADEMPAA